MSENTDSTVPWSMEAERAVLGACLITPDAHAVAAQILRDGDWWLAPNRYVWQAMRRLRERTVALDLITVRDELGDQLESVGGPAYVSALADGVVRSTNVRHYASIVAECAGRRRLLKAAAGKASVNLLAVEVDRLRELQAATEAAAEDPDDIAPFVDVLDEAGADAPSMVPSDVLPYLAWEKRISILAGAPKAGKSTLLCQAVADSALGAKFLSRECHAGQVAIVTEEPVGLVGARLRMYGLSAENHKGCVYVASPSAGVRVLHALRKMGPSVVIVDTFTAFAVASGADSLNDAAGMRRVIDTLRSVSEEGAAVLLVHHVRKADGLLADSRDIAASVDQIVTLEAVGEDNKATPFQESDRRRLSFVGRWPVDTLQLAFSRQTVRYSTDAPDRTWTAG